MAFIMMGDVRSGWRTHMIEVRPGIRLAVDDGGSGPAMVLLHGLAGSKELWSEILDALREVGFRAIAYDQRGHGESPEVSPPWSIRDLAEDLAGLLDRLGVARACVVGHSMGGRALFRFALDRPERLWAIVPVGAQSEAPRAAYREALTTVREATRRGGLPAFREAFQEAGEIPERVARDPAFAADYEAWFARNRAEMLVAALDAILAMPTLTTQLGEIAAPALAVVGERDEPFRALAARYERAMPACRTVVVPDCHHYPMTDQPAAFAETLLSFLEEVRPDA
jgi:pimeloyl-ACP methyl ester carboxylesterase